ncbi:hypothetical protein [Rothia aerolata]|uniref:Uncharacterized protein n=1 Tax=Rothia aerolata TaxID=1812262 RepID=A0A917IRB2_9MICC|nr:hypothetical protein [Rothia aerolata]GGH62118.1 hypothetical protein GCM10007359_12020 [Rothia aerolata]
MALRFHVPPNWPTPPEGWAPEPGWQPDPAWGPAPEGWKFWVEDDETGQDAAAEEELFHHDSRYFDHYRCDSAGSDSGAGADSRGCFQVR